MSRAFRLRLKFLRLRSAVRRAVRVLAPILAALLLAFAGGLVAYLLMQWFGTTNSRYYAALLLTSSLVMYGGVAWAFYLTFQALGGHE